MNNLLKLGLGVIVALGSVPSAQALGVAVDFQNGESIRMDVSHKGQPIKVRMVAIDKDGNVLDNFTALPEELVVTASPKPRKVFVKFPSNTHAVCAQTSDLLTNVNGAHLDYRSCVRVRPGQTAGHRGVNSADGLKSRLGSALRSN